MKYLRCPACGGQNRQSDQKCYQCSADLHAAAPASVAAVGKEVPELEPPEEVKRHYTIERQDGRVVLTQPRSHAITAALLRILGGTAAGAGFVVNPSAITFLFFLICLFLWGLALRELLTELHWEVAPGRLTQVRKSPWGVHEQDFSRASLQLFRGSNNSSSQAYLVNPGESINALSTRFCLARGRDEQAEVGAWLAGLTGLANFKQS